MENYKNQHPKKCACGLPVVAVYEKFQLEDFGWEKFGVSDL